MGTLCGNIFPCNPVGANVLVFWFLRAYFNHDILFSILLMEIGIFYEKSMLPRPIAALRGE